MKFRLIFDIELEDANAFASRFKDLKEVMANEIGIDESQITLYIEKSDKSIEIGDEELEKIVSKVLEEVLKNGIKIGEHSITIAGDAINFSSTDMRVNQDEIRFPDGTTQSTAC